MKPFQTTLGCDLDRDFYTKNSQFGLCCHCARAFEVSQTHLVFCTGWLTSRNLNADFEMVDFDTLDMYLRQFYAEARKVKGEKYSKNALVGLRAGINRHLTSPPYSFKINIMKDREFRTSNQTLLGVVKELKRDGLDKTQHRQAIPEADVQKCYSSGVLSDDNPTSLQLKVWFELSLHLGRRGRDGLHNLQKDDFEVKVDESGDSYVQMCYNEADKATHGVDSEGNIKNPRMYATGLSNCPVKSFQLYVAKLNPYCKRFFQRPKKRKYELEDEEWYVGTPVGRNKIGEFMKVISEKAGLSVIYTNHCLRATLITKLHHAGVSAQGIMSISGHRNEKSVKSYVDQLLPSSAQRKGYSNILASAEDVDVVSKTVMPRFDFHELDTNRENNSSCRI